MPNKIRTSGYITLTMEVVRAILGTWGAAMLLKMVLFGLISLWSLLQGL